MIRDPTIKGKLLYKNIIFTCANILLIALACSYTCQRHQMSIRYANSLDNLSLSPVFKLIWGFNRQGHAFQSKIAQVLVQVVLKSKEFLLITTLLLNI